MSLAPVVLDLAVRIMPVPRRSWAEAARAELEHVPPGSALGFALGGLMAAIRFRLVSAPFVLGSVRYGLAVGAAAWALAGARAAFHLGQANDVLPAAVLLTSAVIYGLGALITALAGLRVARTLTLALLAVVATFALIGPVLAPKISNLVFYRALATEDVGILLTALLLVSWALGYGQRWAAPRA